ncbi:hypothetical protein AAE478_000562 [Parahypoxylon ruwenzoriense]
MRFSYLLLPLVAGVVADASRSAEGDSTLKSRDQTEIAHSLEARLVSTGLKEEIRTVASERLRNKRDRDDYDEDDEERFKHALSEMEHDDHRPDAEVAYVNGKAVTGGVIGGLVILFLLLAVWYFVRIRPRRKLRQRQAEGRNVDIEKNSAASSTSTICPPVGVGVMNQSQGHLPRDGPAMSTPSPVVQARSVSVPTLSGPAPSTPGLTYSPSVVTSAGTPTAPPHLVNEKPPAYATVVGDQSSEPQLEEPQLEETAHYMGQVPAPSELPIYHLPVAPQPGATDMKGEPISRY